MALVHLVTLVTQATVVLERPAILVNLVGPVGPAIVVLVVTPAFPVGLAIAARLAIQVILVTVAQAAGPVGQVFLAM